jgi:regulator of sigma E protease
MTTALAFLFVLGVLIFVHELGHFLVARWHGVRVHTFSLGFGPKLLKFRRGDTEYCISAVPLGGYVKLAGETVEEARTGAPDEFLSKSKWERFQVLIMGPVMNLALAIVVMALVLYQGAAQAAFSSRPAVVGSIEPGSVAAAAGIRPGDLIVSVDGKTTDTWDRFALAVGTKANRQIEIVLVRDGKPQSVLVTPRPVDRFETGHIGVGPLRRPQIAGLTSGGPAEAAGVRRGDVVLSVNGEPVTTDTRIIEIIRAHGPNPLEMQIERDWQRQTIRVTPRQEADAVRIGAQISPLETITVEPGIVEAFKLSLERNWDWTVLIFETIQGLFTRDTSVKQLMGPVGIAGLSGEAAEAGLIPLFTLMALISLNLGIMNLMPIPVLDGGHIAILAVEGLSRRDFSMKVKEKMLLAGFVLLVTLMVTVIYNDLTRVTWIEKLMPWR